MKIEILYYFGAKILKNFFSVKRGEPAKIEIRAGSCLRASLCLLLV
jgi:hypothetical protein